MKYLAHVQGVGEASASGRERRWGRGRRRPADEPAPSVPSIWVRLAAGVRQYRLPASPARPDTEKPAWQRTEKRIGNIVLFAEDWRRAVAFYRNGLGVPVDREYDDGASFRFGDMTVGVLDLPGARGLTKPAEVGGTATGLRFTFCMFVDDLDAACAELAERGVQPRNDPWEFGPGHVIASFADPAGHIWELVAGAGQEGP